MYHYQENIQDGNGTVLNGWSMGLYAVGGDPVTAPAVTIYSDRAGATPIPGGTVRSVTKGYVNFYVPSGRYSRRYYDASGALQWYYDDSDMVSTSDLALAADLASTAVGKGSALVGTPRLGTVELDITALVLENTDTISVAGGSIPAKTTLGKIVTKRIHDPTSSGWTEGVDASGYLTQSNVAAKGAEYILADGGSTVCYMSMEFVLKSGGTSSPDQQSVDMMPWTVDFTSGGALQIPPTSAHMVFSRFGWSVGKILTTNGAVTNWATGVYPGGYLAYDIAHFVEASIVDGTIYIMIDNQPLMSGSDAVLTTLTGNYAGFELYKNNTNDGNPGVRRMRYSNSVNVAIQAKNRYLAAFAAQGQYLPSDKYVVRDDFLAGLLTTGNIGNLGWNIANRTVSSAASSASHPGVRELFSTATAGTVSSMYLSTAVNVGTVSALNLSEMSCVLKEKDAGATNHDIRVGLTSDASTATPGAGIYLELLTTDTNWFLVGRNSSVQTRVDTGVAGRTTSWINGHIYKKSDGIWACTISVDGGTASTEVVVSTNVPVGTVMIPAFVSVINDTTARNIYVDYFSMTFLATAR